MIQLEEVEEVSSSTVVAARGWSCLMRRGRLVVDVRKGSKLG